MPSDKKGAQSRHSTVLFRQFYGCDLKSEKRHRVRNRCLMRLRVSVSCGVTSVATQVCSGRPHQSKRSCAGSEHKMTPTSESCRRQLFIPYQHGTPISLRLTACQRNDELIIAHSSGVQRQGLKSTPLKSRFSLSSKGERGRRSALLLRQRPKRRTWIWGRLEADRCSKKTWSCARFVWLFPAVSWHS